MVVVGGLMVGKLRQLYFRNNIKERENKNIK